MQHPPAEKSFKSRFRQVFALADGCEPDPRFTLANELTFLAWIRTALALLASGIALDALPLELLAGRPQTLLSHALTGMALLVSVNATLRWLNVERALRHRQALPYPILAPRLGLFGLIVSTLLLLALRTPNMPLHDDQGLQPERTALTWERTVLSTLVLGCIVFRHPLAHYVAMTTLMLMAVAIGTVYSLLIGGGYRRSARHIREESSASRPGAVVALGFGVALLSIATWWST